MSGNEQKRVDFFTGYIVEGLPDGSGYPAEGFVSGFCGGVEANSRD